MFGGGNQIWIRFFWWVGSGSSSSCPEPKPCTQATGDTNADQGYKELATFLLVNGADINVRNKDGNTALMIAVRNDNTEIATFLIENGADLEAKGLQLDSQAGFGP